MPDTNVTPDTATAPEGEKKGRFTLTRKQWSTGFRGVQLALCGPCFHKFRSSNEKFEVTDEGTRVVVDVCTKCAMHASRLRFE